MKKIAVITTGGTIAMKYDVKQGGYIPAVSGRELIDNLPQIKSLCEVELFEFSNIPSSAMTPEKMLNLTKKIKKILYNDSIDGIVVTHGTDTLEETAYFVDLCIDTQKIICFTAAMRNYDSIGADGPQNILSSIRVALNFEQNEINGVFVVINDEIYSPKEVTKIHSGNIAAFSSPFWGPIGYIDSDKVIIHHILKKETKLWPNKALQNVELLKIYTGMTDNMLNYYINNNNLAGLVLEGFGRGNIPSNLVDGLIKLVERGIYVIICTRVLKGGVVSEYASNGCGTHLKKIGLIFARELSSQKARIKLMLLLASGASKEVIIDSFNHTCPR